MRRRAAVAGSWYPDSAPQLTAQLQAHLRNAHQTATLGPPDSADLVALVAPHAGLLYSGPVAAHAYRLLKDRRYESIVIVGPSHFVPFDGVSIWPSGEFDSPFGPVRIDEQAASRLRERCPIIHELPSAHEREHSVEMQLPFIGLFCDGVPILPLVMGRQTRETAFALGDALADLATERNALFIASSDLSHYFDAVTAARLDAAVVEDVETLDEEGLMTRLEARPDHACGGGPIVSVLRAAKACGATTSQMLRYADSGDVSGDKSAVVGYLAAAIWK